MLPNSLKVAFRNKPREGLIKYRFHWPARELLTPAMATRTSQAILYILARSATQSLQA